MDEKDAKKNDMAGNSKKESIMLISNITVEPYFGEQLHSIFSKNEILIEFSRQNYEDYDINHLDKIDTIILWLDFNTLFPNLYNDFLLNKKNINESVDEIIKKFQQLIHTLEEATSARILMFGFEDYSNRFDSLWGKVYSKYNIVDRINCALYEGFPDRVTLIDLKHIIATVGIQNSFDNKMKYRWGNPYSKLLISEAVQEIYKQYLVAHGMTRKCIVLDCDNVLWGGILSEDGRENLQLGELGVGLHFQDFQRYLLRLYASGVILAVCSNNDLEDVLKMFREHSAMVLKEEHISCFQVNWENKCNKLKKISEILNIGLDSMVFIDDSPFEIETVNMMLPDLLTILFEKDTIYSKLNCFHISPNVDYQTIVIRNDTYKNNINRQQLRERYQSYEEYLENLQITVMINKADSLSINRISELSQRTNKCTNGKRYTTNELKHLLSNGLKLLSVYVSDKFGDLGLVGAIGIHEHTLKLFCLSCRALGRNVEKRMLMYIKNNYTINQIEYNPTSKNHELINTLFKLLNKNEEESCLD